jgi:hypothetical protein
MLKRMALLVVAWGGVLFLVACAPKPSSEAQAGIPSALHEPRIADWNHPFGVQAQTVQSVGDAQQLIKGFQVLLPNGLGTPHIFVGQQNPPDAVIFLFHTPQYGLIWVAESSPPDTPDPATRLVAWRALVADSGKPEFLVTSKTVQIRNGNTALLQYAEGVENPRSHTHMMFP